jgi:nitrite reductase (NADH) large subunit
MTRELVVVGHGMVGHRLVADLRARDSTGSWHVTILCEEPSPAYNRARMSSFFDGKSGEDLSLVDAEFLADPLVDLRVGTPATQIDRAARTVTIADGRIGYDALVLATGSRPFLPPVPGGDLPGCFAYRTLEDLEAIKAAAVAGRPGVVIGGGLLGLEAADALRLLGMRPHIVELASHLMPTQLDGTGAALLASLVEPLGLRLHCGTATRAIEPGPDGRVSVVVLADGTAIPTDLVVFSAGVRPRDELAAPAGLTVAGRGGVLVDDRCRTNDPRIWAIGECAAVDGRCYALVSPGYRMAEVVVSQLLGVGTPRFPGADLSTTLKLLGVEVASFGDAHATTDGALVLTYADNGTYAKLVLDSEARTLLGGILAGDASAYPLLHSLIGHQLPASPDHLLARSAGVNQVLAGRL